MSIKTFKLCLIIFFSLGVVRSIESRPNESNFNKRRDDNRDTETKSKDEKTQDLYSELITDIEKQMNNIQLNIIAQKQIDLIESDCKEKNTIELFQNIIRLIDFFVGQNLNLIFHTINSIKSKSSSINDIMKSHQSSELKNVLYLIDNINGCINLNKDKLVFINILNFLPNNIETITKKMYNTNLSIFNSYLSIQNSYHSGYNFLIYSNNFSKPNKQ